MNVSILLFSATLLFNVVGLYLLIFLFARTSKATGSTAPILIGMFAPLTAIVLMFVLVQQTALAEKGYLTLILVMRVLLEALLVLGGLTIFCKLPKFVAGLIALSLVVARTVVLNVASIFVVDAP